MIKDFLIDGGANYSFSIVNTLGQVVASGTAHKRTALVQIPNISESNSRLYYLDGDSTIRYLEPDGTTGTVGSYSLPAGWITSFSVSPDDQQIAIASLSGRYPMTTHLYVQPLSADGLQKEIFSGPVREWPVGWHEGRLIIAVGINVSPQNAYDGFEYSSLGYHVVDPANGNRLQSICDGWTSYYPPVPAGTLCINGAVPLGTAPSKIESWDGASRTLPLVGSCPLNGALSPDGSWIASNQVESGGGCTGQNNVYLLGLDGHSEQTVAAGGPGGWIDSNHLVVVSDTGASPTLTILDTRSNAIARVSGVGFFAGRLPGSL